MKKDRITIVTNHNTADIALRSAISDEGLNANRWLGTRSSRVTDKNGKRRYTHEFRIRGDAEAWATILTNIKAIPGIKIYGDDSKKESYKEFVTKGVWTPKG